MSAGSISVPGQSAKVALEATDGELAPVEATAAPPPTSLELEEGFLDFF